MSTKQTDHSLSHILHNIPLCADTQILSLALSF